MRMCLIQPWLMFTIAIMLHAIIFQMLQLEALPDKSNQKDKSIQDGNAPKVSREEWKDHDEDPKGGGKGPGRNTTRASEVSKDKPFTLYGNTDKKDLMEAFKEDMREGETADIQPTKEEDASWSTWSSKMEFTKYLENSGDDGKVILDIRKAIFVRQSRRIENVMEMEANRSDTSAPSFTVGLNAMAAMTMEERAMLTGLVVVNKEDIVNTDNQSSSIVDVPSREESISILTSPAQLSIKSTSIPSSIDWRQKGAVSDVKMQGMCGACWAFAATGLLEGLYYKKYGYMITFSEQELIDCDRLHNTGCVGGNFYYALTDYYKNQMRGISTGKDYPYVQYNSAQTDLSDKSSTCSKLTKMAKLTDPYKIRFVSQNEASVIEAISRGPVAMAVSGYSDIFQFYTGGIIDSVNCGSSVDHAVLAVGYTENYIIIKNSWGPDWGENGYARIKRGSGPNGLGYCGIYTQVNEIMYDDVNPISCYLSNNSTQNSDPCKKYQSDLFCTSQFGCQDSDFYNDFGIITSNVKSINEETPSPSELPNLSAYPSSTVYAIVGAVCAIIMIVGFLSIYVLLRYKNRKKTLEPEKKEDDHFDYENVFWKGESPRNSSTLSVRSGFESSNQNALVKFPKLNESQQFQIQLQHSDAESDQSVPRRRKSTSILPCVSNESDAENQRLDIVESKI